MSFDGCDSLEYVDFTEICSNLDMRNCKNLNQACIDKIISALCDFASKPYSNAIPSLTFNAYIGPQQTNIIDNARVAAMQAKGFTVSFLNV
ncbi:MAG: hypothetical protein LBE56_12665 [Tannerella sp.]|jgi:hypothetical protein|nr:hypothetical protein [Tannerella sp.]